VTEPQPSAQEFLASLPDATRAEVTAHLALGKTNLAMITLQQVEPRPAPRLTTESLVALAAHAGVDLVCPMCGEGPATVRDDYLLLPLCDDCSAKYMTVRCPDCGAHAHVLRSFAHEFEDHLCVSCESKRTWAALPQETREEIDHAVASLSNILAIKRIKELIRSDGLQVAIALNELRRREQRGVAG
jgi:hypothetical protein